MVMHAVILIRLVPSEAYEVNELTLCVDYGQISRDGPENSGFKTTITKSLHQEIEDSVLRDLTGYFGIY